MRKKNEILTIYRSEPKSLKSVTVQFVGRWSSSGRLWTACDRHARQVQTIEWMPVDLPTQYVPHLRGFSRLACGAAPSPVSSRFLQSLQRLISISGWFDQSSDNSETFLLWDLREAHS
jgi:hypothetical protein